ncbi:recombination-associated protein RdgC [Pokkaliibacter sp. CJK22405]|uniref:recombination-associated protein RdgC n=1 Tax=Pokkaliibacter sp. CJK22405 TaxID=3384615 RepID=UPI0039848A6E
MNVVFYQITKPLNIALLKAVIDEKLQELPFTNCSTQEAQRLGFVCAVPGTADETSTDEPWHLDLPNALVVRIKEQQKKVSKRAHAKEVERRANLVMEEQGRRVNKKERQDIKDQVMLEMLPRTYPEDRYFAITITSHWVAVPVTGYSAAESLLSFIREALGTFPVIPVRVMNSPEVVMTSWINNGAGPDDDVTLFGTMTLADPADDGVRISCRDIEPFGDEVRAHLEAGRRVTSVGVMIENLFGAVISSDLIFKNFQLAEFLQEELEHTKTDTTAAEYAAWHIIMADAMDQAVQCLPRWFGSDQEVALPAVMTQAQRNEFMQKLSKAMAEDAE